MWATKQLSPYGPKIAKSFRFDELGAEGDDTWLGGGAPRRKGSPNVRRTLLRIDMAPLLPYISTKAMGPCNFIKSA